MTNEQFNELVDLISRIALLDAGILQGSPSRAENRNAVVEHARSILVEPEPPEIDFNDIYGWGGQDR